MSNYNNNGNNGNNTDTEHPNNMGYKQREFEKAVQREEDRNKKAREESDEKIRKRMANLIIEEPNGKRPRLGGKLIKSKKKRTTKKKQKRTTKKKPKGKTNKKK